MQLKEFLLEFYWKNKPKKSRWSIDDSQACVTGSGSTRVCLGTCFSINETTPAGLTECRWDDDDAPLMDHSSQQVRHLQPTLIKHVTEGTSERRDIGTNYYRWDHKKIPFEQRQEFMNPPLKTLWHFMCKYSPTEGSWGLHNKAYTLFLTAVKHLSNWAALYQSVPSSSRHFRQCFASPVFTDLERNWPTKCIISGRGTGKRPNSVTRTIAGCVSYDVWKRLKRQRLEFCCSGCRSIENLFLVDGDVMHHNADKTVQKTTTTYIPKICCLVSCVWPQQWRRCPCLSFTHSLETFKNRTAPSSLPNMPTGSFPKFPQQLKQNLLSSSWALLEITMMRRRRCGVVLRSSPEEEGSILWQHKIILIYLNAALLLWETGNSSKTPRSAINMKIRLGLNPMR